jgi:integrase
MMLLRCLLGQSGYSAKNATIEMLCMLFLVQAKGERVNDWEKSWKTACTRIDTALFHDLRRTALTNMIEAGFSEKEAMEVSGHKTRNVFDRYHIVSERRIKQLGNRMEVHLRNKDEELMGTDSGHKQDVKN